MANISRCLYKIITASDWEALQQTGYYSHESLQSEGFIHFALAEQLLTVARKHFADKTDLYVIAVNPAKLEFPWVMEDLKNKGVLYPHLYGLLNAASVEAVYPFEKNAVGEFELPEQIK